MRKKRQVKSKNKAEETNLPQEIFLFPLVKRPLFPGMVVPILVESGPLCESLKEASLTKDKLIGLTLLAKEAALRGNPVFDEYHKVGVTGKIIRINPVEQGGFQLILSIEKRFFIEEEVSTAPSLKVKVSYIDETKPDLSPEDLLEMKAYAISVIATVKELIKLNPLFKEELEIFLSQSDFNEPQKLTDLAVALTTGEKEELQDILSTIDGKERIAKTLILLKKELDIAEVQHAINQKIDADLTKTQKDYVLREQLKTIKKELGLEKDDKANEKAKFEERLKNKTLPEDVKKTFDEELDRFTLLDRQSSEYNVCRTYLDWLTVLPWGVESRDSFDLSLAKKVLETDHYGLKDINERILEFMSVGKLSGKLTGSIICLVGPPGVGKTSLGKSIAKALQRKFYRFSVGGMTDEAEIKGHRRTYVGALPGKIIQALKQTQTMNPIIMLDEVDKIGKGGGLHGDPASALLEVLDPEQNKEFLDHYLDIRFDLSKILFIVTANVLDTIPDALRDRMEILRLSGYMEEEKVNIATKYLIPKNCKEMGLKKSQISFEKEAVREIISSYAREAGVRHLETLIKKILRKRAMEIVEDETANDKKTIDIKKTLDYLGKPKFISDRLYNQTPSGVTIGLAWTSLGGAILYVESIAVPHEKTGMKLTGQAGQVMKESSEIAWSFLHSFYSNYGAKAFFSKKQVHIHIPEGATPKDGPSAGVTMVSSLLSLLIGKPIRQNLGMTGELTITGKVLPVGGIKEKVIAAKRSGLKEVILPRDNVADWEELPKTLKKGLTVHFAETYDDVFKIAF